MLIFFHPMQLLHFWRHRGVEYFSVIGRKQSLLSVICWFSPCLLSNRLLNWVSKEPKPKAWLNEHTFEKDTVASTSSFLHYHLCKNFIHWVAKWSNLKNMIDVLNITPCDRYLSHSIFLSNCLIADINWRKNSLKAIGVTSIETTEHNRWISITNVPVRAVVCCANWRTWTRSWMHIHAV